MWRSGFRAWFYFSVAAALLVSVSTRDAQWLTLEGGIIAAILGRYPLFDQPEEPKLQRPLTVFMVFPFTTYVLLHLVGRGDIAALGLLGEFVTMMATLLMCLFLIMILVKRTSFHMNYRFVLGLATVAAISQASLFAILAATYQMMEGAEVSNGELMRSLVGILAFGLLAGALFKRDMRRMDYQDILMVPEEAR